MTVSARAASARTGVTTGANGGEWTLCCSDKLSTMARCVPDISQPPPHGEGLAETGTPWRSWSTTALGRSMDTNQLHGFGGKAGGRAQDIGWEGVWGMPQLLVAGVWLGAAEAGAPQKWRRRSDYGGGGHCAASDEPRGPGG